MFSFHGLYHYTMSQRGRRTRGGKVSARQSAKDSVEPMNVDPQYMEVDSQVSGAANAAGAAKRAANKKNSMMFNNEAAKSKLSVVIDILTYDDNNFNEQTLRHNVQIAVKHLLAVKELL